jgi:hypothetical protein
LRRSFKLLAVAVVVLVIISVCVLAYSATGPTGLTIQNVHIGNESGVVRVGMGGLGSFRMTKVYVMLTGAHVCYLGVDLPTATVGLPGTIDLAVTWGTCRPASSTL